LALPPNYQIDHAADEPGRRLTEQPERREEERC